MVAKKCKRKRRDQGSNIPFKSPTLIIQLPSIRPHLFKVPLPPNSMADWDYTFNTWDLRGYWELTGVLNKLQVSVWHSPKLWKGASIVMPNKLHT
jgi:hypothetical protein